MAQTPLTVGEQSLGDDGEAELTDWLVSDGAQVTVDEAVAELSTSKAIIEVQAPVAGRLRHLAEVGASVLAESAIGLIEH